MAMQRARKREQKQERRAVILVAAQRVFGRRPWPDLTMAEVAREANLSKGALFLYYSTKEALFLLVLELLLTGFFGDLTTVLSEGRTRWTPQQSARILAALVEKHPQMSRLLGLLHPVLEQNVEEPAVRRFREFLVGNFIAAGDLLDERMPFLAPGGGARLMLRLFALVIGLRQMTEPGPVLRELSRQPGLTTLEADFHGELPRALLALIGGMSVRQQE